MNQPPLDGRAPRRARFWYGGLDHNVSIAGEIMQNPIVRTFVQLAAAEQARNELLAAGIAADNIAIDVRIDESGPVQGNFTVGDDPSVKGKTAYSHTYAPTAQEDVRHFQITVTPADAAQAQQAVAILDRLGALDPDRAARAAQASGSTLPH
jgi:hypothetical protein